MPTESQPPGTSVALNQVFPPYSPVTNKSQPPFGPVIYDLGTITPQPLVVSPSGPVANRSVTPGLNQYDLRGTTTKTGVGGKGGVGPYRGTINAGSDLFASLSQTDQVSDSIFAETARRPMTVVNDPGTASAPGTGRMAFQVLRDGSLIMTGRTTPSTGDQQVNLTQLINGPHFLGDASAVTDAAGITHVFGRDLATGGLTQYIFNPRSALSHQWTAQQLGTPPGNTTLDATPSAFLDSVHGAGAMVTTSAGHLLVYDPSLSATPLDLTAAAPSMLVYSSVGVVEVDGEVYAYGTDQKGDLIEYSYAAAAGPSSLTAANVRFIINASDPNNTFPHVFQDVDAVSDGATRQLFMTNGYSELVHVAVGPGNQISGENVTQEVENGPASQIIGYAAYQVPYAGRIYSETAPLVDPVTHDLYVYGTNGRDLVEFHRPAGGSWQVIDLTNNVNGGNPDTSTANKIFGAPGAYMLPNGSQHILMIDEEGEVIEYYQLGGRGSVFNTQNITLDQGQATAPTTNLPPTEHPTKQPQHIGPNATLLVPDPYDPVGHPFQGVGVLQNPHQRAAFRFVAPRSGTVVASLLVPFAALELESFNPHGRLLHRNQHPERITNALGQTYYQSQTVLQVVSGKTYYFLVKGTPRPKSPTRPPGFGNFVLEANYSQGTGSTVTTLATSSRIPHGPLRVKARKS
jgi:hypothetical protein